MRNILNDNSKDKTFDDLNNYHKCNAYLINQICYNKLDTIKSNLKNENEFKNLKFNIKNI